MPKSQQSKRKIKFKIMKKLSKYIFFGLIFTIIFAFSVAYEPKKATAEVEQEEGLYIFYRSKPVMDYEYIGTYKIGLIWDDKPKLLFKKLVKKTKEKFPNAEAIIIDNDMEKCDAIKFK
jgi:hypothetical protein